MVFTANVRNKIQIAKQVHFSNSREDVRRFDVGCPTGILWNRNTCEVKTFRNGVRAGFFGGGKEPLYWSKVESWAGCKFPDYDKIGILG